MLQPTYMKLVSLLLGWLLSTSVWAEYDAAELGKLFTDREQRSHIDAARSGKNIKTGVRQASKVNVNGYLTRSDGKSVVWINDESTLDSSVIGSVRVYPKAIDENNKKVPVVVDGNKLYLKPGETWSKSTGKVKENY